MKTQYTGIDGRALAIDLAAVEAVLDEDGETHLVTSAGVYKVREPYPIVYKDWRDA